MKTIIAAATALTIGITAYQPAVEIVVDFVTPILKEGIRHNDDTIATWEYQFPGSEGAKAARIQWEEKKVIALQRIEWLQSFKTEIPSEEEVTRKYGNIFQD